MAEQAKNPSGPVPSDAASETSAAHVQPRKRRGLRAALFVLGPALVFVGAAYFYLNTGRYAATENAYVQSDTVLVSAEVSGPIVRIAVRENEPVQAGAVLFEIDADPYKVKVDRAKAQVGAVESFIESLEASYRQQQEQLELARINVAYRERELARQQELAARKLGTDVDVDDARHELDVAEQQIPIIEQALAQLRAQIGGQIAPGLGIDALFDGNAAFRTVKSMLESAELDLAHTVVRAPFAGIVGRVPAVGHYVAPGSPVMSLVADGAVWIEANYKETELTHVEPGQPARLAVTLETVRR